MAHIRVKGDLLLIDLSLVDKILAIHGSLQIPLQHIASVQVADENGWKMMWRKIIGTNAAGIRMAGTFVSTDGLIFCDFKDGKSCVQMDLEHETYKQLVVQLDDSENPNRVAARIRSALTT